MTGLKPLFILPLKIQVGQPRYTAALDPDNLQDSPDGEGSVLEQIKDHRNPWFEDEDIQAYDTRLDPIHSESRDCYEFSQSILPVYETLAVEEGNTLPGLEHAAGKNSVMIYYIQYLQSKLNDQGVLKYSVQKVNCGSIELRVKSKRGSI